MSYLEKSGALYGSVSEIAFASQLTGEHLGRLVHFAYTEEHTALEILVIGELREVTHHIHHDLQGSEHAVHIWVTGRENTSGDKREFQLQHNQPVALITE